MVLPGKGTRRHSREGLRRKKLEDLEGWELSIFIFCVSTRTYFSFREVNEHKKTNYLLFQV